MTPTTHNPATDDAHRHLAADARGHSGRAYVWITIVALSLLAAAVAWLLYPRDIDFTIRTVRETPEVGPAETRVFIPHRALVGTVATYHDELFAYLMFDHLRNRRPLAGRELLLTFDRATPDRPYRLLVVGGTDMIEAIPRLIELQTSGAVQPGSRELVTDLRLNALRRQTELFLAAYNLPVRQKMEELPRPTLNRYLAAFIRFKSNTDPRVTRRIEPVPDTLSPAHAQQLAGDILTIADFYDLPLEFFLGIGAMENNYMNARGDLAHSVWKKRAHPDDVILERKAGRVRVLNDSAGVWQITRETLRYAHLLIRRDKRDYSHLPEHLRPPEVLNVNDISPAVLTTYAGVLLRDLLDRFNGDVTAAVSAYNGGPARPNYRYGAGVERAAAHARHFVEQAAVLNGESVVQMTWLRRP